MLICWPYKRPRKFQANEIIWSDIYIIYICIFRRTNCMSVCVYSIGLIFFIRIFLKYENFRMSSKIIVVCSGDIAAKVVLGSNNMRLQHVAMQKFWLVFNASIQNVLIRLTASIQSQYHIFNAPTYCQTFHLLFFAFLSCIYYAVDERDSSYIHSLHFGKTENQDNEPVQTNKVSESNQTDAFSTVAHVDHFFHRPATHLGYFFRLSFCFVFFFFSHIESCWITPKVLEHTRNFYTYSLLLKVSFGWSPFFFLLQFHFGGIGWCFKSFSILFSRFAYV